jgi:hypothetical protein
MIMMDAMTDEVRKDLNLFLDILGSTQNEQAEEIGINRVTLSRMQNGETGQLPEAWIKTLKTYGLRLAIIADDQDIVNKARESIEKLALAKRKERLG